ncbi:hypothetical protein SUGI_0645800 [Cryptomeria japonica]|nr:hypothetical protein SUGI_0645800 [Cryptomeria japonica]
MENPATVTEESDDQSSVKSDDQSSPKSDDSSGSNRVKFLYSYGGRILPRLGDGILRYVGGETRVMAVNRNVTFSDLMAKIAELLGSIVALKCQLPTQDLDALVSIKSDEDLDNLLEEYDGLRSSYKVRAFLFPLNPPPPAVANHSCPQLIPQGSPPTVQKLRGQIPVQIISKGGRPPRPPLVSSDAQNDRPVRYATQISAMASQQNSAGRAVSKAFVDHSSWAHLVCRRSNNYNNLYASSRIQPAQLPFSKKATKIPQQRSQTTAPYEKSTRTFESMQFLVQH